MNERPEPPGLGEGRYANYFKVGHNAHEFLLEFGQMFEDDREPQMFARMVTSPPYAKALLETLGVSVQQFEAKFGPIPDLNHEE